MKVTTTPSMGCCGFRECYRGGSSLIELVHLCSHLSEGVDEGESREGEEQATEPHKLAGVGGHRSVRHEVVEAHKDRLIAARHQSRKEDVQHSNELPEDADADQLEGTQLDVLLSFISLVVVLLFFRVLGIPMRINPRFDTLVSSDVVRMARYAKTIEGDDALDVIFLNMIGNNFGDLLGIPNLVEAIFHPFFVDDAYPIVRNPQHSTALHQFLRSNLAHFA